MMFFLGVIVVLVFYCVLIFIMFDLYVIFVDYWCWWIVYFWVEGIFEVFVVILMGWLLVDMKLIMIKLMIWVLYF